MRNNTISQHSAWQVLTIMMSLILGILFASRLEAQETEKQPNVAVSAEVLVWQGENAASQAKLVVTAKIADGLHIYAQSQPKPFLATKISVADSGQFNIAGEFLPTREPIAIRHNTLNVELLEFEDQISWETPIEIAAGVNLEDLQIEGTLFSQACEAERCFAPETLSFMAKVRQTQKALPLIQVLKMDELRDESSNEPTAATPFDLETLETQSESESTLSIWAVLPLAFVAGFILNFMPCVLPVVGLKVLSFVQQAGNNRRRVFMLNLSYSLGIVSVLLTLATLAVFAGFGWGEQFSSVTFTVVLASIVFAFALSFLGVWDIRIPGFVNNIDGGQNQEGLPGAFSKGVLGTVLATPCSGPFLGSALAWAVVQPAYLTYLVFGAVGLGMASPFLAIGFFPRLVNWLPKPGAWMKGFKQSMGFVLIATVVFLLSFIKIPALIPSLALLAAIGLACWWYGQLDSTRSENAAWKRLASSVAIVAIASWMSFGWLYTVSNERFERAALRYVTDQGGELVQATEATEIENEIPWQPYSQKALESAIASGKTVFVDFTADWCLTCKANESVAINQPEVADLIRRDGIVAFRADKTEPAPEVDRLLKQLGNNSASIPFYAVFPEGNPSKPITLDGIYSSPQPFVSALTADGENG